MTAAKIWDCANEHREVIQAVYRAICDNKNIDSLMSQLKQLIPCLFGVDADKRALIFRSTDEGLTAIYVEEQQDTLALAMATDVKLD